MKKEKSFNKTADSGDLAKRIIADAALAALGFPLVAGGIRAFNSLSKLPVPAELENQKGILEELEYKLIKNNPDLFTKTQIKLIGERKKKELIEKIKKIKDEEKLEENQKNLVKENEEAVDNVDNFITKNSSITKTGDILPVFQALWDLFAKNPIYPFALVAAPGAAFLLGQHLVSRTNEDLANKYTKKYLNAAKSRFYNDILDLQLFNKKKIDKEFKYENLLELPARTRKKLRDILLESSGKDYGPYLGLDVKYPELLPDKPQNLESMSVKTAEGGILDVIGGILGWTASQASPIINTAIILGISYPVLAFTASAIASYHKTKPVDAAGKLKEYLRKTREITYIPEEVTPKRITSLTESVAKEVHPEDLFVGILDSKSKGTFMRERMNKEKENEEKDNTNTTPSKDKEPSEEDIDQVLSRKFESIRRSF